MRMRLFWLGLVLCLGYPNYQMVRKQNEAMAGGRTVYLELTPVDPRSLMQGDYMRLNYTLVGWENFDGPASGSLDAELDAQGRVLAWKGEGVKPPAQISTPLASASPIPVPVVVDHIPLAYTVQDHHLRVAPDSFFFPEGNASRYRGARYGIFTVTSSGTLNLRGLADRDLKELK